MYFKFALTSIVSNRRIREGIPAEKTPRSRRPSSRLQSSAEAAVSRSYPSTGFNGTQSQLLDSYKLKRIATQIFNARERCKASKNKAFQRICQTLMKALDNFRRNCGSIDTKDSKSAIQISRRQLEAHTTISRKRRRSTWPHRSRIWNQTSSSSNLAKDRQNLQKRPARLVTPAKGQRHQ